MKKSILMIVVATVAMLAGVSGSRQEAVSNGVIPWCPPFCSK